MIDLLTATVAGTPLWFWAAFVTIVLALTAFDLGFLHRKDRAMGIGESLKLTAFYIAVALAFGGWVWAVRGSDAGIAYYTGFAIEKALSIDNVFVISLIFTAFAIPAAYQYRALLWGIIGVIVLRGIMIGGGAALVASAHWVLYIFAAILIVTGIRMLFPSKEHGDVTQHPIVRWIGRWLRLTPVLHGPAMIVTVYDPPSGRLVRAGTPLLLALIVINLADLVFAIDSVPAIFAITTDPFVVYTSNIMAILGLRALYFALAAMIDRFTYLKYALAIVLVFIGSKIFVADFLMDGDKFPPLISLGVTLGLIAGGIGWSLWATRTSAVPQPPAVTLID